MEVFRWLTPTHPMLLASLQRRTDIFETPVTVYGLLCERLLGAVEKELA